MVRADKSEKYSFGHESSVNPLHMLEPADVHYQTQNNGVINKDTKLRANATLCRKVSLREFPQNPFRLETRLDKRRSPTLTRHVDFAFWTNSCTSYSLPLFNSLSIKTGKIILT